MRRTILSLACLGLFLPHGVSQAQKGTSGVSAGERIGEFGAGLPLHPGVVASIEAFRTGDAGFPPAFAEQLARAVRTETFRTAREALDRLAAEGCRPFVRVTFPDPDHWDVTDVGQAGRKLLEGMVKTEAVACFSTDLDPETVLDRYTSPEFRMRAESRIKEMVERGGLSCVRTGGVPILLDPTEACNEIHRLSEGELAAEHSQVVRNGEANGIQLVYLKESLKTFVATPEGLQFHYVNISRSVDLGWSTRWIAEKKIKESEEGQVEALRSEIEKE